ncbi:hypothetical protein BDW74DRAFT_1727 [Aspergillus multicolor]|uniref:uncharacterized protein n=1 Tax=Aspergillus multicolor TaxID=41759 RepID=UPI003CCCF654
MHGISPCYPLRLVRERPDILAVRENAIIHQKLCHHRRITRSPESRLSGCTAFQLFSLTCIILAASQSRRSGCELLDAGYIHGFVEGKGHQNSRGMRHIALDGLKLLCCLIAHLVDWQSLENTEDLSEFSATDAADFAVFVYRGCNALKKL